ncbi:MAG: hypothetical protein KJ906_00075 [Nanoarchaeota archaeon]|nr:hypothetical protein [Nanoarchaeota archaeon]
MVESKHYTNDNKTKWIIAPKEGIHEKYPNAICLGEDHREDILQWLKQEYYFEREDGVIYAVPFTDRRRNYYRQVASKVVNDMTDQIKNFVWKGDNQ